MKTPNFLSVALIALVASTTVDAAAYCDKSKAEAGNGYFIFATGVDDIGGTCGGLWDNLKGFGLCGASDTVCEEDEFDGKSILKWKFRVPIFCSDGSVEAAWWEATRNQYGSINCHWD